MAHREAKPVSADVIVHGISHEGHFEANMCYMRRDREVMVRLNRNQIRLARTTFPVPFRVKKITPKSDTVAQGR